MNPNIQLGLPNLDEYYLMIAHTVKSRANCLNRAVGSILVDGNKQSILATGYNGVPRGLPHCVTCRRREEGYGPGEGLHRSRAEHAERSVIEQAARFGRSTENSILYVTDLPCDECTKAIINAGVKEVIYGEEYPHSEAKEMLTAAGVKFTQLDNKIVLKRLKVYVSSITASLDDES